MWNKRIRRKSKNEKLDYFLESMQNYDEGDAISDVKSQVEKMQKQGKSVGEIIDALIGKVDSDTLGQALVEMGVKNEEMDGEDVDDVVKGNVDEVEDDEGSAETTDDIVDPVSDEDDGEMEEDRRNLKTTQREGVQKTFHEILDRVLRSQGVKNPENVSAKAWEKLAFAFEGLLGEGSDEEAFSEVDFVLNASDKIGEEMKVESSKVREILAQEMKHYRESDPNFREEEFSNAIENASLKKESCKKK